MRAPQDMEVKKEMHKSVPTGDMHSACSRIFIDYHGNEEYSRNNAKETSRVRAALLNAEADVRRIKAQLAKMQPSRLPTVSRGATGRRPSRFGVGLTVIDAIMSINQERNRDQRRQKLQAELDRRSLDVVRIGDKLDGHILLDDRHEATRVSIRTQWAHAGCGGALY